MSLRRKLVYLLVAFAVFALVAAFGTIYGIQFRVDTALQSFQSSLDQTHEVDELRLAAREQRIRLHDLINGRLAPDTPVLSALEAYLARLEAAARFSPSQRSLAPWDEVLGMAQELQREYWECVTSPGTAPTPEIYQCLEQKLEHSLLLELDSRLLEVKRLLDDARNRSLVSLATSGTEVLGLALVIGAFGAGLVVIGAALIRRWLIRPIGELHAATRAFAHGNLDYRVAPGSEDELGRLAEALNQMAGSLLDAQAQLRRAEAMEATVTLARGVAHDFNNLLTSATGTLTLLAGDTGDPQQQERLNRALQACRRAGALSRKLLDFARGTHSHPQVLALAETVEMILNSLDESALKRLRIALSLDRSVRVYMDRDGLIQVILNLITNACDAMPEGGDLRIAVRYDDTSKPAGAQTSARLALLEVADSGPGMTPEVRNRIFEPFFSTKTQTTGHGRGLGLAIVYTAVQTAGGTVRVDTAPGRGAVFRVWLPSAVGEGNENSTASAEAPVAESRPLQSA